MTTKSANKTILVIEDDLFLMGMYKTKLELEGYKVLTAEDGEKGLKLAATKSVDLVLLDVVVPKIDGFEVLKRLRQGNQPQTMPIILLTNLAQREEVEKGLALGATDYMIKVHFVPSEVVTKIKKFLV
jgi:DNA-binding response OmpR family regulator